MKPEEFEFVHAYLSSDDDDMSGLIYVREDAEKVLLEDDVILGDARNIGKSYILKDMNSIDDLNKLIPHLGKIYTRACSFGLLEMASSTIARLQVAWNVYSGIEQLPLFLDFIEGALPYLPPIPANQNVFVGSTAQAAPFGSPIMPPVGIAQLQWIVSFLAETMMLFIATDPKRYYDFMQKYPKLESAVCTRRSSICLMHGGKLALLQDEFMKRKPFTGVPQFSKREQEEQEEQKVPDAELGALQEGND